VAAIDWGKSAQDVYNLVRGCDPQPGAYSQLKGEKVRFYGAKLLQKPPDEVPGTVVKVDTDGFQVAAKGAILVVSKVRPETGGKMEAAAFASERGLQVGDRFGNEG
jgi:methionyl-tRNA formyltransferase